MPLPAAVLWLGGGAIGGFVLGRKSSGLLEIVTLAAVVYLIAKGRR